MNPLIVKRKEKDTIHPRVYELAKSFTPDWKPDFNNPDFGSALALIYCDMYREQADKLNKLPFKQRRDLVNQFHPVQKEPKSSRAIITFVLSTGATEDVFLKKGFQLLSKSADGEDVYFETAYPLCVTPSRISKAFVYDHETGWFSSHDPNEEGIGIPLFKVNEEENRNEVRVKIIDDLWLTLREGMRLGIRSLAARREEDKYIQAILTDRSKVKWYLPGSSEERELAPEPGDDGWIWFNINENESIQGEIYCEIYDIPSVRHIYARHIELSVECHNLEPEQLMLNDTPLYDYSKPFGEKFIVFDALYIGDSNVFTKQGKTVSLVMDMDEELVPIQEHVDTNIQWRNVMHESELRKPEAKTVRIDLVQWEYWNGLGWRPLNVDAKARKVLSKGQWKITFTCPDDIKRAVFGPHESHFIRARIMKIDNAFTPYGDTAVPILKSVSICIEHNTENEVRRPFEVVLESFGDQSVIEQKSIDQLLIPSPDEDLDKSIYIAFTDELTNGPIRIEVTPKGMKTGQKSFVYRLEYYGIRHGKPAWYELPHEDESNGLIQNGLISFMAPENMHAIKRFGHEGYYLRLTPMYFNHSDNINTSIILRTNSVAVKQQETMKSEFYEIPSIRPWAVINLSRNPVLDADVWINEIDSLSDEERERMKSLPSECVEEVYDNNGELVEVWRKWTRVDAFSPLNKKDEDRIFVLDGEQGQVKFGNGQMGRIPQSYQSEFIRIDYVMGGGNLGNVKKFEIDRAVTSIPFLERVYNGEPAWGGQSKETTSEAEKRICERIRHRDTAVTERDIKSIVMSNQRSVHDIKVTNSAGSLILSVMPNYYPYQKTHFSEIRNEIENILQQSLSFRIISQKRLQVREPEFIAYCINMVISVSSPEDYLMALGDWQERLDKYFNPLNWRIGQVPDEMTVISDLKRLATASEYLSDIIVQLHYYDGTIMIPLDQYNGKFMEHMIPVSGIHNIKIKIKG